MDFYEKMYAKLVGGKIVGVARDSEEPEQKGLEIQMPNGQRVIAWILQDPEGNGPGCLDIVEREKHG